MRYTAPTFCDQNSAAYDWRGYNDLRRALINHDQSLACRLINDGVEVNSGCVENRNDSPLHLAVITRCPETTKLLVSRGADTHAIDWNLDTPITLAAKMENRDLIKILLSCDVQNHDNSEYFSHLHVACVMNRVDIVKKLVLEDYGENINRTVSQHSMFWPGYTPLHFAVHYGCIETVECLLHLKADMMIEDSRKSTPLHLAYLKRNVKIVDLLLAAHKHEFKNSVNQHGLSHFHIACSRDNTSILRHFMQLGVNVDNAVSPPSGYMGELAWQSFVPMNFAMYHNCPRVIEFLLGMNARMDFLSSLRLLSYAFMEKNETIHGLFKPNILAVMSTKQQAQKVSNIHRASIDNDVEAMKQLSGASNDFFVSLDAQLLSTGLTALSLGVRYNSKEAVEFLINHEVDIFVQDSNGETPVHIAFRHRFVEILELLMRRKIMSQTRNVMDNDGLSIFHILCTTDKIEAIKNFINNGVDINAQVSSQSVHWGGFTALHFASLYNQTEIVELLLDHNADITITNGRNPFDLILENLPLNRLKRIRNVLSHLSKIMLRGTDRNFNIEGFSLLHTLCMDPTLDLKVMHEKILSHINEINKITNLPQLRKYNKCTPLHIAILFENFAHANLLLENGADPFVVNDMGKTPLECISFYTTCALSLLNVVNSVLDQTSDENLKMNLVNCRDNRGCTPLHSLALEVLGESRTEVMRLLLTNGADVDARNCQLETPLHLACFNEDLDVVNLLLEYGGDVNAQDIFGNTPFHSLLSCNLVAERNVITSLLDNGHDINLLDRSGVTCLMIFQQDLETENPEEYDDFESFRDCAILYLKHVKKLQFTRSYIIESNLQAYSKSLNLLGDDGFDETAFDDQCKVELGMMESVHIDRYTTLRDILRKSLNEMVFHSDNVSLIKMADSNSFCEKYPMYGSIVKLQLKKGRFRRPLQTESEECLLNMMGIKLPQSCMESILQYLDNKDLKHIIMSRKICG